MLYIPASFVRSRAPRSSPRNGGSRSRRHEAVMCPAQPSSSSKEATSQSGTPRPCVSANIPSDNPTGLASAAVLPVKYQIPCCIPPGQSALEKERPIHQPKRAEPTRDGYQERKPQMATVAALYTAPGPPPHHGVLAMRDQSTHRKPGGVHFGVLAARQRC
ncbi:hypothetical protein C8Q76DRAFT_60555 [Earliella scabrosa]|nr:hypothetical protein C8Q76DRAFT_60555 [Earliella scabrosa]